MNASRNDSDYPSPRSLRNWDPELEELIGYSVTPVEPSAELKASLFDALPDRQDPEAHAAGEEDSAAHDLTAQDSESAGDDRTVVDLDSRRAFRGARWAVGAAAASVLLIVGGTTIWSPQDTATNTTQHEAAGEVIQGDAAHDVMDSIMAAHDVRSTSINADGANLDVVVSHSMGKGGAMVNGFSAVDKGMGAQVWSIDEHGRARSAGVIAQEPHSDVWMPLPADTMSVMVTEEPISGSHEPSGEILAEQKL
ncbi:hypothetical protein GC425_00410 [Corynebacterium sp. zg254]|uniref:Anti-sigma factor n=1 Tax=Corynebacterium zhongnanshanii TaxID=2768834 RepID=A0ABQ6VGH3_9CORY|nr:MULTISPECIES: anti-sigma factor [Corynebacterium]KAB3523512.1 anti-sigma factor [Corynebacterium zhongnanshanii]MCR5913338.1 hypothetical protein [Corynebacterium sp. zg254]